MYTEKNKCKRFRPMEIYIIDIWLSKLNYGWSVDDVPNEEIREEIKANSKQK